jgi:RasGEF domain/RhoGAP domain/RasGEF N-terminal motif
MLAQQLALLKQRIEEEKRKEEEWELSMMPKLATIRQERVELQAQLEALMSQNGAANNDDVDVDDESVDEPEKMVSKAQPRKGGSRRRRRALKSLPPGLDFSGIDDALASMSELSPNNNISNNNEEDDDNDDDENDDDDDTVNDDDDDDTVNDDDDDDLMAIGKARRKGKGASAKREGRRRRRARAATGASSSSYIGVSSTHGGANASANGGGELSSPEITPRDELHTFMTLDNDALAASVAATNKKVKAGKKKKKGLRFGWATMKLKQQQQQRASMPDFGADTLFSTAPRSDDAQAASVLSASASGAGKPAAPAFTPTSSDSALMASLSPRRGVASLDMTAVKRAKSKDKDKEKGKDKEKDKGDDSQRRRLTLGKALPTLAPPTRRTANAAKAGDGETSRIRAVPLFVRLAVSLLQKYSVADDIFMESADLSRVEVIEHAVADGRWNAADYGADDAAAIATVLKRYFEAMSPPLLTNEALPLERWIAAAQIGHAPFSVACMRSALRSLPEWNRVLAQYIFSCLAMFNRREQSIANLAFGLGPALLRRHERESATGAAAADEQGRVTHTSVADCCRTMELLIVRHEQVFSALAEEAGCTLSLRTAADGSTRLAVGSATLAAAIDRLLDENYEAVDKPFVHLFLFTHTYFVSSRSLLLRLVRIYHWANPKPSWTRAIRLRVVTILKIWLEDYLRDLQHAGQPFVDTLSQFLDSELADFGKLDQLASGGGGDADDSSSSSSSSGASSTHSDSAKNDVSNVDGDTIYAQTTAPSATAFGMSSWPDEQRLLEFIRMYALHLVGSLKSKERLVRNVSYYYRQRSQLATSGSSDAAGGDDAVERELDIVDVGAEQAARALTLIDHGLFKSIPGREFIRLNFQSEERAPCFAEMAAHFNRVSQWAASEIVRRADIAERAALLAHFVDIAEFCRTLKNFNTCFAIVAGLNLASISRLRHTWAKLASMKKVKQRYDQLLALFSMDNNFGAYRAVYSSATLPKVPYLMLLPKDLLAIEENNPTTIGTAHINFVKMRLLWKLFADIKQQQQAVYPFTQDPALHVHLTSGIRIFSEKELFERSLVCEPREAK